MPRRIVSVSVVPGQPTDGSGRVCIHLLVRDERGPIVEPHALHPKVDELGNVVKAELVARPTRMRLACDGRRRVAPVTRGKVTTVTHRTEEPTAVTCPKCKATTEYANALARIEEAKSR